MHVMVLKKEGEAVARGTALVATFGRKLLKSYLVHVQRLQEMRPCHVHVWNEKKKKCKMPLTHCQSAENSATCKAFFPRTMVGGQNVGVM